MCYHEHNDKEDLCRSIFKNNNPKDFGSILNSLLLIYFEALEVSGDKAKGDSTLVAHGSSPWKPSNSPGVVAKNVSGKFSGGYLGACKGATSRRVNKRPCDVLIMERILKMDKTRFELLHLTPTLKEECLTGKNILSMLFSV